MQVTVSNIVFVEDKVVPGRDKLVAVFNVTLNGTDPRVFGPTGESCPNYQYRNVSMTIKDFRYYVSERDGDYVSGPAVKTRAGYVRPIGFDKAMSQVIYDAFMDAWAKLPKAPAMRPA